jgi:hypothetical protein
MAQVVERLLSKHKTLKSNPSTTKKKKVTSNVTGGSTQVEHLPSKGEAF